MKEQNQRLAVFAIIFAAIMAGSSGVFVKYIGLPPASLAFIRVSVPFLLIGSYLLYVGRPLFRQAYPQMLIGSTLNAIRMYFFISAFTFTSISKAVLIMYTWPIFTNIFSILFLKEKVSARNLILLIFAFSGIIIVNLEETLSLQNDDFLGLLFALGTAFIYAITIIIFKPQTRHYTKYEIVFYQNLISIFVFLPFFLHFPMPSLPQFGLTIIFALLLGTFGFLLFFYALTHLPASTTSSLAYIEIISATLFGITFFEDQISFHMVIGGAMILLATALLKKT